MTPAELDLRIRQMHASLGEAVSPDLSVITVQRGLDEQGRYYVSVDVAGGTSDVELMNIVEGLTANIARLKDHLNEWCRMHGRPSEAEQLVNTNRSVALVHDMWNTQKHARLDRPRSGVRPRLVDVTKYLRLTTAPVEGASAGVWFDPSTGQMVVQAQGGKAEVIIDGDIVDEHGAKVAVLATTWEEAVDAWEAALTRAGVPVPARPVS